MQQKKCTKIPGILPQVVAIVCVRIKSIGEVDETISSEVRFGNNREVPVKEKGKISIKLKNGELNWIGAVLYVPRLHESLVSVGQLSEKRYKT